jgi:hypothetical protein
MPLGMSFIELGQEVEITTLLNPIHPGWWMDIEQW